MNEIRQSEVTSTEKRLRIKIPAIVSITMLLLALPEGWPYGYYILLRWVVCGSSAYIAFVANGVERRGWMWGMGFIALLFNPLVPVHLDKATWTLIDLAVAVVFVIALVEFRKKKHDTE